MFWLDSDTERRAYIAHEHGRLIVTLGGGYHFDLDRLHEHHARGWSWVRQMQDKSWCRPEHVELLLALEDLFPYDPPTA